MPSLTGSNKDLIAERYILDLNPIFYARFWLKDGNVFVSNDAAGRTCTVSGALWTAGGRLHDGIDDLINTGSDWIGTSALTIMGWINPTGWGGGNTGRIFDNGKTYLYISSTDMTNGMILKSNASATFAKTADNAISLNTKPFFAVTRTAAGLANFYIGSPGASPLLSGAANQSSDTPAAGTTNVFIGNRSTGDRGFAGTIGELIVVNRVLMLSRIQDCYLLIRHRYP